MQSQRAIRADVRLRAEFRARALDAGQRQARRGNIHADRHRARRSRRHAPRGRRRGRGHDGVSLRPDHGARARVHELVDAGFSEADAMARARTRSRSRRTISAAAAACSSATIRSMQGPCAPRTWSRSSRARCRARPTISLKRPGRVLHRQQGAPQPEVRRGRRARHPGPRARYVRGFRRRTFVCASQVNYESIHKHDAFAEAFGMFGEFREELRTGAYVTRRRISPRGWARGPRRFCFKALRFPERRFAPSATDASRTGTHTKAAVPLRPDFDPQTRNAAAPVSGEAVVSSAKRSAAHSRERAKAHIPGAVPAPEALPETEFSSAWSGGRHARKRDRLLPRRCRITRSLRRSALRR